MADAQIQNRYHQQSIIQHFMRTSSYAILNLQAFAILFVLQPVLHLMYKPEPLTLNQVVVGLALEFLTSLNCHRLFLKSVVCSGKLPLSELPIPLAFCYGSSPGQSSGGAAEAN